MTRKLKSLGEGPMLTKEVEDRIFAKIEDALDQGLAPQPTRHPSRAQGRLAALGAYLPRPVMQRRADALALVIEDFKAGRQVTARGELGTMLAAVAAMKPLPAIEPDPSFVDWLEKRLISAQAKAVRSSTSPVAERIAAFNTTLRNWRLRAGLAGAAASVVAMSIVVLQGFQTPTTRTPAGPIAAPPVVVDQIPPTTEISEQVAQATASRGALGTLPTATGDKASKPGDGESVGSPNGPPPPDNSGLSTATSEGRNIVDRIEGLLTGSD